MVRRRAALALVFCCCATSCERALQEIWDAEIDSVWAKRAADKAWSLFMDKWLRTPGGYRDAFLLERAEAAERCSVAETRRGERADQAYLDSARLCVRLACVCPGLAPK